jgi:hypothetical protein
MGRDVLSVNGCCKRWLCSYGDTAARLSVVTSAAAAVAAAARKRFETRLSNTALAPSFKVIGSGPSATYDKPALVRDTIFEKLQCVDRRTCLYRAEERVQGSFFLTRCLTDFIRMLLRLCHLGTFLHILLA